MFICPFDEISWPSLRGGTQGLCIGRDQRLSIPRLTSTSRFPTNDRAVNISPPTAIIPSTTSSPHRSPNIPLRYLRSESQNPSARVLESASEKGSHRSSISSAPSVGSDFSLWTDTGDLAEQLTDAEDPLRIRLIESLDRGGSDRVGSRAREKQPKRVHYQNQQSTGELDLEKIEIPQPLPRKVSRIESFFAAIMSPGNRQLTQTHGLVGKPLL